MKITLVVIAFTILIFGLQLTGMVGNSFEFMPTTFESHPYSIITSIFLHANVNHILLNMVGLLIFGLIVESELDWKRWILLYITSGVIGNIGYMLVGNPFIPAIGASGAIFGLMGAAAVLKPKQIIFTQFGPFPMWIAAILWGITEVISFFGVDNIAQSAHIFGLVGGIIILLMYKRNFNLKELTALFGIILIIPIIIGIYLPHELKAQTFDCPIINKNEDVNFKEYIFNCNNSKILSIAYPANSKVKVSEYYTRFPNLAEEFYKETGGINCNAKLTNFNTNGSETYATGRICNSSFYASAKNVGYSRIEIVRIQ